MVDVELTCWLFKDVEENSKEFTIVVHTTDYIDDLKEKIYEKVKKTNNDFLEIEADDLRLWKVEIDNNSEEEFSNLVLNNNKTKNVTKLRERVENFWDDEERRPKEGCTHVIVDSSLLSKNRELVKMNQINQDIMDQLTQRTANLSFNQDHDVEKDTEFFTQLSDMLDAIKKRSRFYGNTKLQLTFRDKIVHEGDEVKYRTNNVTKVITTLRVAEGWAYINYEKSFHPTVTSFLKKKLDVSDTSCY
ncbi:4088_t:CDS:2 [Funneliformis caledonium]|uniref:4088_t:CDS:1 n=1 Tax=Funneliformis caledonium TaxID=1117310 RepID=A0A9N9CRT7_9GLOM|nr:4088_t:CDS:2 [Funneliformis caledonium]